MKSRTMMGMGLLAVVGLLSGCNETVDSQNIKTPGISATIVATAASNASTKIVATLQVGGPSSNTYVALGGGDRIFASAGDNRIEMQAQDDGVYQATFNTAAKDTAFIVDIQREVEADAPANQGTLPAPFDLTIGASAVSRNADITFTWTPFNEKDDVTLDLRGACIFNESIDVPGDSGAHTIPAGTLRPTSTDKPESCDVTVEMRRMRKGTTDTGLDSESTFTLEQVRTGSFTSDP